MRLGALALEYKLPTDAPFHALTKAGGLMTYSTDVKEGFHRTAYFVDRLFKGAKASDLPFEQISNPKLTINLKTAKALGVTVPETVLVRADEVIR
jgi:putative ABC transport system substrate-binding protein